MNKIRFECVVFLTALSCLFAVNPLAFAEEVKGKVLPGHSPIKNHKLAPDQLPADPKAKETTKESTKEPAKEAEAAKVPETPIENVVAVTTEQLVSKPQDYLNRNVKFTAPFFAFSNLALDYKPAFRSSRTYLSFLVLRPNTHTPFSEIKLALLVPKEKDPQTKLLQTLKEGYSIEIIGKVFACPLDEPWLDVLRLKKIGTNTKKGAAADEKSADDKDASDETKDE